MDWSRAYAQYFHLYFHVFQSFMLKTKCKYSCSLEPLAQHKKAHQSCHSGSMPNTKHIYTYISSTIGLCPIYKTNHHVHMQWGLWPNIKYNINIIIMINRLMPISGRSKVRDIRSTQDLLCLPFQHVIVLCGYAQESAHSDDRIIASMANFVRYFRR